MVSQRTRTNIFNYINNNNYETEFICIICSRSTIARYERMYKR